MENRSEKQIRWDEEAEAPLSEGRWSELRTLLFHPIIELVHEKINDGKVTYAEVEKFFKDFSAEDLLHNLRQGLSPAQMNGPDYEGGE
jgi:hypothetical protein